MFIEIIFEKKISKFIFLKFIIKKIKINISW